MGMKSLLIMLISLSFSIKIFADDHENAGAKTPAEEASIMPVMDDKPPVPITEKEVMFSGDFAGSYSMLSDKSDPDGDFDVNLAQFNVKAKMGPSHLNFGFGYGSTIRGLNDGLANSLGLLNASYHMKTSYGLGFMMGRFESPVGHESYNHRMNNQFTRSYGFDLAPYFSTGLGLNYGQDIWTVGLLITNGRGEHENVDEDLTMAVTIDIDLMEELHIDLNYVTGNEKSDITRPVEEETEETPVIGMNTYSVSIIDASVSYVINDMLDVALNYIANTITDADIGSTSLAAYVNAKYSYFNFGLRYEQFNFDFAQRGDLMTGLLYNGAGVGLTGEGTDNSLSSFTFIVKANMNKNTGFFLEHRMDKADDGGTFVNADGDESTDSFNRTTVGLMYNF